MISFSELTSNVYDNIDIKEVDRLYFTTDTNKIYLNNNEYGGRSEGSGDYVEKSAVLSEEDIDEMFVNAGAVTPTALVSINKPNTWVAGTEYNFGDGVYGQRFTGTITAAGQGSSGNTKHKVSFDLPNISTFINIGGSFVGRNEDSSHYEIVPAFGTSLDAATSYNAGSAFNYDAINGVLRGETIFSIVELMLRMIYGCYILKVQFN